MKDEIFFKIKLSEENYIENNIIYITPNTVLTDIPYYVIVKILNEIIVISYKYQDYGRNSFDINNGMPSVKIDLLSGRIFEIKLDKDRINVKSSIIKDKIKKMVYTESKRFDNNINFGIKIYKMLIDNTLVKRKISDDTITKNTTQHFV